MNKEDAQVTIMLIIIAGAIFFAGYAIGYARGIDDYAERTKENKCLWDYSFKPAIEVSAECYKYFDIKK
jgi:hypothetical protein